MRISLERRIHKGGTTNNTTNSIHLYLLFVSVAEVEVGGVDVQVAPDEAQHEHVVQREAGNLKGAIQI